MNNKICYQIILLIIYLIFPLVPSYAFIYNIESLGVIADNSSLNICNSNTVILNNTLASLVPNDVLLIPNKTFWVNGGIYGKGIKNVTIIIDGTLKFSDNQQNWPYQEGKVKECIYLEEIDNVTFTSNGIGTIDGNGKQWWGYISYLKISENRPRLLSIYNSKNILIENLLLRNSPYWTTYFNDISDLEIRFTDIDVRRTDLNYHDLLDIAAFNTDGFDIAGRNVWIHDCNIWNDDDCIAVKGIGKNGKNAQCSENMLFERINASGVGLTIGSIGPSLDNNCVRNITFRDCKMENTYKGIYMKSRPGNMEGTAEITNILYQNIYINNPTQWSIWIGPQQAIYSSSCNIFWPVFGECPVPSNIKWENITLNNITINNPRISPGVILGNKTNPMKNIVFKNVYVNNPGIVPFGFNYYKCENVIDFSIENAYPIPQCS